MTTWFEFRLIFSAYVLLMNTIAFLVIAIDKMKAQKGRWRIKESQLLWISALGGAQGMLIGMTVCRHKTQKKLFYIGVPVMLILQLVAIVYLLVAKAMV